MTVTDWLVVAGLALIISEMLSGQFVLFGLGVGALALAGARAWLGGPESWIAAVALWAAVAACVCVAGRRWMARRRASPPNVNDY